MPMPYHSLSRVVADLEQLYSKLFEPLDTLAEEFPGVSLHSLFVRLRDDYNDKALQAAEIICDIKKETHGRRSVLNAYAYKDSRGLLPPPKMFKRAWSRVGGKHASSPVQLPYAV